MQPHRVQIVRVVESVLSIEVEAQNPREAERLARERVPADGSEWIVVNREVSVAVEEQ